MTIRIDTFSLCTFGTGENREKNKPAAVKAAEKTKPAEAEKAAQAAKQAVAAPEKKACPGMQPDCGMAKPAEQDGTADLVKALADRFGLTALSPAEALTELRALWDREDAEALSARGQQETQRLQRAKELTHRLEEEAQQAMDTYPALDLMQELEDPLFLRLVKADVPVKRAYETVHLDDILSELAAREREKAQKEITDNIRKRGMRPFENGIAAHGGITLRSDVSRLTREQREDYARRAARGEEITFRR